MSRKPGTTAAAAQLRRRAEAEPRQPQTPPRPAAEGTESAADPQRLLHELQVHQNQLAMQNAELREARERAVAAAQLCSDLYDFAPAGYCTVSEAGLILEANLTLATLLGVPRGALIGQLMARFILPEDVGVYSCHHQRVLGLPPPAAPLECELRMVGAGKESLWVRLTMVVAQGAGGVPVCRIALSDITRCRRAEQELQETGVRLRFETLLADLSARFVGLRVDQIDAAVEEAQRQVCECLGLDLAVLWQWGVDAPGAFTVTHRFRRVDGPPITRELEAASSFPWTLRRVLAGVSVVISSVDDVPEGAERDQEMWRYFGLMNGVILPLSTGGSAPFGVLSFHDMVTPRTWSQPLLKRLELVAHVLANALSRSRAEQALRESEARLSLAADSAGIGLWSLDLTTHCYWLTTKARELMGIAAGEGLTWDQFVDSVHPEDRARVTRCLEEVVQSGNEGRVEYRVRKPDGDVRWMASRGRLKHGSPAGPACVTGVTLDITARQQAEQQIARQRDELAHVARVAAVGELASALAHELNQPLGAILRNAEAAELLLQEPSPDLDELCAILADICQDDHRAGAVIDRIRALMRRSPTECVLVDLNQVANEVSILVRPDAEGRRVHLVLETAPVATPVQGDPVQLQQALLNLLLNAMDAVASSPRSDRRVTLRVWATEAAVGAGVSDSGPGVPAELLPRIFEPFYTSKPTGLGMGLPIARSIVEAHGGRLWAENGADGGMTFAFSLPVARAAEGTRDGRGGGRRGAEER